MNQRKQALQKTLVTDARAIVRDCAATNIRLAARRITQFLETRLQPAGLTVAQFGLMAHIAAGADDTIGALVERTGLDQSTLSRNLRGLERLGLVEIAVVEKDLRRRAVWLSEEGARRLEAAVPIWREAQTTLSAFFDPQAIGAIAQAAAQLSDDGPQSES